MPAGLPYFAWIDASETTFESAHMRWDESIFSFELAQEEGDPASLTIVVRRPRNEAGDPIGLLGPGRKIWAWFALDCGSALIKFRGRLVGIPTSIFEELVTLEFIARPIDVVAQKEALANTLRVLPYYDEIVLDPKQRTDPEVVLEGYTKIWHFDRETHVVTVSDEISGEDGLVEFDGMSETGKVLYDGLGLTLTSGPLSRVDVNAEYTWTQQARGTVDLTNYLISHWPDAPGGRLRLSASDWPKHGTGIGDGWVVAESTAADLYTFAIGTHVNYQEFNVKFSESVVSKATISESTDILSAPVAASFGPIIKETFTTTHDGSGQISHSISATSPVIVAQEIMPTLVAGYTAERPCTEKVSLTLVADVQSILTEPEDGEALRLDDIRSVNLSEAIGAEVPIGDPRRRSYIATARGNRSIEHLIALARAHLMKRARVVEISFAPKLTRMPEVTLRKNAFLVEPRIGQAVGKIISYSIALDGSDGRVNCGIRIGCAIGRSGTVAAADGGPTYCTIDYAGPDYQQFINRTVLLDTSVGYQPPAANPNDDGIDFLSTLRAEDVIETGLVVETGPDPDEEQQSPTNSGNAGTSTDPFNVQEVLLAQATWMQNAMLPQFESRATFKLKSMTREFSSDYEIQVTDLKIPTGYDLEAS